MGKLQTITGFEYGDYPHTAWIQLPPRKWKHAVESRIVEYKGKQWIHTIDYDGFTGKSAGSYTPLHDTCEPMDDIPF